MLTPQFTLSQNSKTVTITVIAKHCKLGELEVEVTENCFLFFCWPYYLRLTLPGNIIDDHNTKISYNADKDEFIFCYTKAIESEVFENLDHISKLLFHDEDIYEDKSEGQKITMLSANGVEEEASSIDWSHLLNFGFGFALLGENHFKTLHTKYFDVFEVDPFKANLQDRRKLRMENESLKFNVEHYICDLLEDDEIIDIMHQTAPWENIDVSTVSLTAKEMNFLRDLPQKAYHLNSNQVNFVYNSLIDILYAYCYNMRVTNYEENSESGWNIVTLSASLSWLDVFESPREALIFSFRRSLIYPLYRNFELSKKILEDLKSLLQSGETYIIKCFIEIYYIFLKGDCCRYILNNLFIIDYIRYILQWDKDKWQENLQTVLSIDIKKADLGLNLLDLEQYMLEESMAKLEIGDNDSDDSSETTSTSETVSTSDDESSDEHLSDSPNKTDTYVDNKPDVD